MIPCDKCIEIECDKCPLWNKYKGGQTGGTKTQIITKIRKLYICTFVF